ncbi:MAG: acyltransferase [Candidatus Hodarchaeota archaeon]
MTKKAILNVINEKQKIINVKVGKNVKIFDFVNLYECSIGNNSKVGTFVEIQKGVTIGSNVKIQSHTFICEGVTIEDNAFIGHGVCFINDRYPKSIRSNGKLQTEDDWTLEPIIVRKGASIGTGTTLLCGIEIGENSIVGAGSVVTKSVPKNSIVAGNPAKIIRTI